MPLVLLALFIGLPILEIYVIIQVGQEIGAVPTLLLLVVESLIGGWIVRREGHRAWDALTTAMRTGELPGRQLADAALVLVGGTLLLTPGFVTDVVGFFFVLPFTRPVARRLLSALVARRAVRRFGGPVGGPGPGRGDSTSGRPGSRGSAAPQEGDVHQIYHPDD